MKIFPAAVFLLFYVLSCQTLFSQDSSAQVHLTLVTQMQDTTITLDPSFKIKNVYARKDRYDAISDSIRAYLVWSAKMHDTVIVLNTSYVVENVYAERDSMDAVAERVASKKTAFRDSLNAIGNALMRAADMQDTVIAMDPSYKLREFLCQEGLFAGDQGFPAGPAGEGLPDAGYRDRSGSCVCDPGKIFE